MKITKLLLTPIVKTVSLLNSISAKVITLAIVALLGKKQIEKKKEKKKI